MPFHSEPTLERLGSFRAPLDTNWSALLLCLHTHIGSLIRSNLRPQAHKTMASNLLTELYNAYKDWCIFNRFSPESARRFYGSILGCLFTVETDKSDGRRLFKGIRLLDERTSTGRKGHKQGGNDFTKAPCLPKLDRIRPSFEQGAKGAKGAFFQKTFFSPPKSFDCP